MRLISYASSRGPRVAAARGEEYVDLNDADSSLPSTMRELLALGPEGLRRATEAVSRGQALPSKLTRLSPVPNPEKVICIGLNYADHARETGVETPIEPVIFNKFPTAIRGEREPIVIPALSGQVDYEAELVAVIGRGGRKIPPEEAFDHIAGYTCGNDVSARDWQLHKPARQWLLGKSFDSFAPIGPELVTSDEVGDPGNLRIQLRLNGQVMQDSSTRQLIFGMPHLVSYISKICTLAPGDLIFTGTPPGVGMARKPPVFLKPGDDVEVEIERVGVLRNPVDAEGL